MAESRKRKSSEDLLREAKEGLAGSYENPTLPSDDVEEPPPLIRPSDRIQSPEPSTSSPEPFATDRRPTPAPPPTVQERTPRRQTRPRRVADTTLPPVTPTSEAGVASASGEKPRLTWLGVMVRLAAFSILALVVFIWVSVVISIVDDPDEASDLLVGGAIMTVFLLAMTFGLFAVSNRLRVPVPVENEFGTFAAPQGQASTSESATPTPSGGSGASIVSYLAPGETVLAQATGVRPGSEGVGKLLSGKGIVALIVAGAILAAFLSGFVVLLIVGVVVSRIISQSKKAQSGDDPVIITLAVTNQRVLAFSRKWWISGPLTPWFSYPLADVVSHSAVEQGNQPTIGMTFTDGRTTSIVVSKHDAIRLASALRTAGV